METNLITDLVLTLDKPKSGYVTGFSHEKDHKKLAAWLNALESYPFKLAVTSIVTKPDSKLCAYFDVRK